MLFLMDVYGFPRSVASNMFMVLPLGLIAGGLALGKIFSTRAGPGVYVTGYLVCAALYLLLAFSGGRLGTPSLLACIFFIGFAHAVWLYVLTVYSQLLPRSGFGAAMGLVNAAPFLGGLVFQPATGYLFDFFDAAQGGLPGIAYRYFFILLAGALLLASITAFWTRVRR